MVEDEPRSERPASVRASTSVDRVRAFIRQDGRLTIRIIADELDINECTVHQSFTQNLNMRTFCAKMIQNDDQKAHQNDLSTEMLERSETEPDFLNQVITGGEIWFFEYDPKFQR
jgi:hypothetical protein